MISFRSLYGLLFLAPLSAIAINVPNFSFETPDIPYASGMAPTNWNFVETSPKQDIGMFDDTGFNMDGSPMADHIDNVDGAQALFFFEDPFNSARPTEMADEIYQLLTDTYNPGVQYILTLGAGGNAGLSLGSTIAIQLYYLRNSVRTVVGSTTITYDAAFAARDPAPINHLYDYSVSLPTILPSDAWANQQIGISIIATGGTPGGGAYWDLDNVRLVPEPGSAGLLLCGGAALGVRRRRRAATA